MQRFYIGNDVDVPMFKRRGYLITSVVLLLVISAYFFVTVGPFTTQDSEIKKVQHLTKDLPTSNTDSNRITGASVASYSIDTNPPILNFGKVTGNVSFVPEGINANALYFNGQSYIQVPQEEQTIKLLSVTGWFKTQSLAQTTPSWVSRESAYKLFPFADGSVGFWIFTDNTWHEIRSPPQMIQQDTWEKWTGVYDSNMMYLYKNNILMASAPVSGTMSSTQDLCIAHDCATEEGYFQGLIDELEIYTNYALGEEEISSQYLSQMLNVTLPKTNADIDTSAEIYLTFNEGITDASLRHYSIDTQGAEVQNNHLILEDNHYLRVQTPLVPLDEFTLMLWVYPNTIQNDWQAIIEKGDTYTQGWHFYIAKDALYFYSGTPDLPISSQTGIIEARVWQHLALTWNSEVVKIYLNGKQVGVGPVSSLENTAQALLIGAREYAATPSLGFDGSIDEFSFYKQAFDSDTIEERYEQEKANFR